jgi:ribosomal protein S20
VEYLTPEMFTEDGINEQLKDIIMQKETLEFQLENLRKQVDDIKSVLYKELLVYERKKIQNPNLVPDVTVLTQLKELERSPEYKDIKARMDSLKIQIKQINEVVESKKIKLNNLFRFHTTDLKNYVKKFELYIDTQDVDKFEELMKFIFEKEFQDRRLYTIINLQRNYPVFNLLMEKVPEMYKTIFGYILREQMKINDEYDYNYRTENNTDVTGVLTHLGNKLNEFMGVE